MHTRGEYVASMHTRSRQYPSTLSIRDQRGVAKPRTPPTALTNQIQRPPYNIIYPYQSTSRILYIMSAAPSPPPTPSADRLGEVFHAAASAATGALPPSAAAASGRRRPTRPAADGRVCVAAGPGVPGLAFRSDGPTLEAVRVRLAPPRPRPVGEEGAEQQQQQQQQQQQEFLPAGAAAEGLASVPLSAGAGAGAGAAAGLRAVHLAASADGRMVCAACSDGSLRCYDAVLAGGGDADADAVRLSPRWAVPGAHSHDDRRGGSNGGAVRSLAFAPSPGGAAGGTAGGARHLVLLVDAAEGSLAIYDAAAEAMMAAEEAAGAGPGTLAVARWGADCGGSGGGGGGGERITSACWSPQPSAKPSGGFELELAVGRQGGGVALCALKSTADGAVRSYSLDRLTDLGDLSAAAADHSEDKDEHPDIAWACTHLDWLPRCDEGGGEHGNGGGNGNGSAAAGTLAAGYCRVIPDEDAPEEEEEEHDADDDYDDDDDDDAEHQSKLLLVELASDSGPDRPLSYVASDVLNLEEVVPYFSVPRRGRHVFYTSYVRSAPDVQLLVVGCNVSSDSAVVARIRDQQHHHPWGEWSIIDPQEGNAMTCPVSDEDDEFTFPCGFAAVRTCGWGGEGGTAATARTALLLAATDGSATPHVLERMDDPHGSFGRLTDGPQDLGDLLRPGAVPTVQTADCFAAAASPVPPGASSTAGPFLAPSAFGSPSVLGSGSSAPVFGSGSAVPAFGSGSSVPSFGFGSAAPSFGAIFGSGSGAPAFGGGASSGGFAALAKSPDSSAASKGFGSASSRSPAGIGAAATSFPFGKPSGDAPQAGPSSGFSFGKLPAPASSSTGTPFGRDDASKVKPFFSGGPRDADRPASDDESSADGASCTSTDGQQSEAKEDVSAVDQSPESSKAAQAYDDVDTSGSNKVPIAQFDSLLDAVGEGLHGDELNVQLRMVDPENTGFITKESFVCWYVDLVSSTDDKDDGGSLDTEEREEREEERESAIEAFDSILTKESSTTDDGKISKDAFPDLMEAMGTTYCDEDHGRFVKKIADSGGRIEKGAFASWYVDWVFGGDDESDFDEVDEAEGTSGGGGKNVDATVEGWGTSFGKAEEGSWKCEICMVTNKPSDTKCAACESMRPGYEDKADAKSGAAGSLAAGSSIGSGGFSFGGASTAGASSSIGAGGFSFGSAAGIGGSGSSEGEKAVPSGGGFTFGTGPSKDDQGKKPSSGGFSFVSAPAPDSSKVEPSSRASSGGFSPMASTDPNRFGGGKAAAPSKASLGSSSGGFPPMASKAPTPFGGGKAAAPTKASLGSSSGGFPPMASKAPTPFGGAKSAAKAGSKPKAKAPIVVSAPKYEAATEYEARVLEAVREFDKSLVVIKEIAKNLVKEESKIANVSFENKIQRMVEEREQIRSASISFDEQVDGESSRALFLLSMKDDLERQLKVRHERTALFALILLVLWSNCVISCII